MFERMPRDLFEVILVDGIDHGTVDVARDLWPSVVAIKQTGKGKENTLASGFWAARGDIIVMLDGDGSTDPAEIPRFVIPCSPGPILPRVAVLSPAEALQISPSFVT